MRRSTLSLPLVLALSACTFQLPPRPALEPISWSVDREALPQVTLRALPVARTGGTESRCVEGGGDEILDLPIFVYVLEHPTEGLILIDAGYGRRTAADPNDYPGFLASKLLRIRMEPTAAAADRLPELGYGAEDVQHVIVTHLHSDHVGGLADFPQSTLWVDRAEWEATGENGDFAEHGVVRSIDFGATKPYGAFPGHIDLFSDGSIILLPTPGHTIGHISVLVNLRSTSLLFVGDAAWIDRNWQEPAPKGTLVRNVLEHDWEQNMDALWRIRDWAHANPDLVIVAGHEPANLERLKAWPEPYE